MMIQGVLGPIDTAELGQTLMHEHITCADWSMRMNFGARFFEFDQVAEIAAGQLGKAKALGVRTVVDGTPVNLGRDIRLIREVARRNPDKTFVVAGGKDLRAFGDDTEAKDTHNVFYPGYVSDAENAALMKHCKLFLHPAVFEGFGIPPLEALALGAPIALANATCLPELYGDTARYFDPYDYDTDLDKLAAQPVAAPDEVLQKYSWDRTANFWLHEIEKYAKQ